MKVLIVSDSHGKEKLLKEIVSKVSVTHTIHCGDFCTLKKDLPSGPLTVVAGNCDFDKAPLEEVWETGGIKFFITHGHQYHVKTSMVNLKCRAKELGAQIVCFGHSHIPMCEQAEGILFINPGSISKPRRVLYPTYALLEKKDLEVNVNFYTVKGEKVRFGGKYRV